MHHPAPGPARSSGTCRDGNDPRARRDDCRLLGLRVGGEDVDHIARSQQGSERCVGESQRRDHMTAAERATRRRRGQQRHHLVFGNGCRQRLADQVIRVGHHSFRYICGGNAVEH